MVVTKRHGKEGLGGKSDKVTHIQKKLCKKRTFSHVLRQISIQIAQGALQKNDPCLSG